MDNIEEIIKYSQNLRLLYVEDNQEARESTQIILEEFFTHIVIAVDGSDGLEKYKSEDIDLIITDINMPKINGLEMTKLIREIDTDVPILVLSAYNESGYFIDSIKLGVEGYLLKPIDIEQFLSVLVKVTEKLKLKDQVQNTLEFLKQYEDATNNSSIVSKTDIDGIITYVNDAFCKISEYSKEELIGNNHSIVRHPDSKDIFYMKMWKTIKTDKQIWKGLVRNLSKSGKSYYTDTTIKPILDADGNVIEYISLRNNITDIMNPKKQLQGLVDSIDRSIAVMIKIENFEYIEKFYNQKVVQKVEEEFSLILMENKPEDCEFERVFTLGYGKYVFAKNEEHCKIGIDNLVDKIKKFQQNINGMKIDIGDIEYDLSILVSLSYGKNVLENINYGIKKLEETKQSFIVANDLALNEQIMAKKNIETLKKVKKAINESKIISYFQPIIDNYTQKIVKYESLVRLVDENDNVISPFFFLDIAKKGKYYSQITSMVLDNSFKALEQTNKDISINLSALDIEKVSTREKVFELLEKNSDDASRIVFELLEDESVKDFEIIKQFIEKVKKLGVKIAIDDFGAGYSNFERLLDYQPDILKIDGCLIKDLETNHYSLSVVKTIVSFAKEQNILIIAEYVENEAIYNILKNLGVDFSQGYYFGKPTLLDNV